MRLGHGRLRILLAGAFIVVLAAHLASSFYYYWENRPRAGDLPFAADFERNPLAPWRRSGDIELCCGHSAHATKEHAREGKSSLAMSLRWDDPLVAGNKRAELRLRSAEFHRDYWFKFSLYLPDDWVSDTRPVTLAQWHGVRDQLLGEGGRAPPLRLLVADGKWIIVGGADNMRITRFWYQTYTNEYLRIYWSAPITRGKWEDWLFKIRWSHQEDGELAVWRDGKQILHRKGANAYEDPLAPFFKIGIYIPSWRPLTVTPDIPAYRVYVDSVRVQTQPVSPKSPPIHRQ